MMHKKLLIGLSSFHDLPFLKKSVPVLDELRRSTHATFVVMDTGWDDEVKTWFDAEYPEVHYLRHPEGNIGYGRSYDEILRQFPGHDFFLVTTSDVLLDLEAFEKILLAMEEDGDLAMAAGKLHYWDFAKDEKTSLIDSLGIVGRKNHHFFDRGQGEEDRGQYDSHLNEIFGISGAVFLIRLGVLPQLFDERFWMYKEDIDLAYRLRWAGKKIQLFPWVWGWHARTISNPHGQKVRGLLKAEFGKKDYGRLHSYKNHLLLLKNHFTLAYGWKVFLATLIYEIAKGVLIFLKSPRVFFAGMKTLLFVKGRPSVRVASPNEMLRHFEP